jgi:hypothetical protein
LPVKFDRLQGAVGQQRTFRFMDAVADTKGGWGKVKLALKLFVGLLVAFAIFAGYGFYKEPIAEAQARDFCSSMKIGDPAEGIRERALQAGAESKFAKWHERSNGERTLTAIFVGLPPFSRHICEVTATDVVVSARYTYLD